jgi:hypothetical protein
MMVTLDVILMALISVAIAGLLVWSICTQHRDYGCAAVRIRRRLLISVRLAVPDQTQLAAPSHGRRRDRVDAGSTIEINAASLAGAIREHEGLPISENEAEAIARSLEAARDDGEFLATVLTSVRLFADRLGTAR